MNKNPVETLQATSLHLCAFKLTCCTSIKNEAEPPPLSLVELTWSTQACFALILSNKEA